VGARLVEGRGVAANLETAALWFSRAADRGMPLAQFRLGNMYEKGLGVKKDLQEARRFYVAAAEKGNANAMHNIAVLYAEGIDGKPDYAAAAQWFLKAARYGIKDSQYNLAILYARGIGVEQNLAEAFKWFGVAALHNDQDAARKRDDVAGKLDQAALAAARLAVQGFVADRQPVEAISTQAPAGGWDDAAATAAPAKAKPRSRLEQSARL
jgi:localization factor PodJL